MGPVRSGARVGQPQSSRSWPTGFGRLRQRPAAATWLSDLIGCSRDGSSTGRWTHADTIQSIECATT